MSPPSLPCRLFVKTGLGIVWSQHSAKYDTIVTDWVGEAGRPGGCSFTGKTRFQLEDGSCSFQQC